MNFHFVTLFPQIIEGYFSDSILKKALDAEKIKVEYSNPRDFSTNRYKKVDEPMVGGGAGMLMTPQPLDDAIKSIKKSNPAAHILFVSPVGKPFTQNDAKRLAKKEDLVFVCGRYEGIDERVIEMHADEIFSIGDYILTGGELAAMVVCDAVSRNVPGVLGNAHSLAEESFEIEHLEAPSFTKPDEYAGRMIISEFLKGNHSKIAAIKKRLALSKTKYFRPDLYRKLKA